MTLIFGGSSFVAKNIFYGTKISRKECDLTKYDEIISLLRHHKPNKVINCAAAHGSAKFMSSDHSYFLQNNLTIDSNLLKACHELNIENVVLMSSVSAFPSIVDTELTETDLYKGEVNNFNFGYNVSKRISYELCKAYQLDYGRNYKTLFLGNLYGKFGKFAKDGNVLNSIIFQMHHSRLSKTNLTLYGDGLDSRAFTFVEDLNQILEKFMSDKSINSAIFSSNEVVTIKQLSFLIAELMEFKFEVGFSGESTAGQKRKIASSGYLQNELSDLAFTALADGLKISIDWYLKSFTTRP
jgi:GDP-L-fucose synthase